MAKKKTFGDCVPSVGMGALTGFLVGGGMATVVSLLCFVQCRLIFC